MVKELKAPTKQQSKMQQMTLGKNLIRFLKRHLLRNAKHILEEMLILSIWFQMLRMLEYA